MPDDTTGVAVIGLACRFPGARNLDEFWHNLVGGVDSVTRSPQRPVPGGPGEFVPARGLLTDPEWLDAGYFGLSPREARVISPQHRVFLECAVEALEQAGYDPQRHPGAIGVYAGGTETAYGHLLRAQRDRLPSVTDWEILLGTGTDFLASRVAYKLGLRGPAITVQAACATSLVAVHTAVQALLAGDCDIALAGGAAVHYPTKESQYSEGGIIARDGTCRTFDAGAGGTVGADGVGIVVLTLLPDALANGDHIHAVIRGSAVNNDGADRVGYTAPSVEGQAAAIRDAQLVAGFDAGTITYVEAHGTATPLGDPIEIAALTKAFRHDTDRRGFCRIGSVKTNIGHTDTAAGAAGLIKTVLALEHGVVPPSLHFREPNPRIDFAASPFRVVTQAERWQPDGAARRAGVSAFGIGGTNAHVVLDGPPTARPSGLARPWHLLVLSARTPTALATMTLRLADHLRAHPELPIADVAWTLQAGRQEHPYRCFAVVNDLDDALHVLAGSDPARLVTATDRAHARPVAFAFPGARGGYRDTARLYRTEPEFRRAVEEVGESVPAQLWADVHAAVRRGAAPDDAAAADLLIFAQGYGLARLWARWGVRPAVVCGTGVGALAAATVAGVFPVVDAAALVLRRACAHRGVDPAQCAEPAGEPRPPRIPVVSAAHGRSLLPAEAVDPATWATNQAGQAGQVPSADGWAALLGHPERILVEVGAGTGRCGPAVSTLTDVVTGRPPSMLCALGELWLGGAPITWEGVHEGQSRLRVPLPTYPFERTRHVVEPDVPAPAPSPATAIQADEPEEDTLVVVTRLFAELLELPTVEPQDDFFDLGGDSLVAGTLLAQVRSRYGVELSPDSIYDAATPAAFAALVDKCRVRNPAR